ASRAATARAGAPSPPPASPGAAEPPWPWRRWQGLTVRRPWVGKPGLGGTIAQGAPDAQRAGLGLSPWRRSARVHPVMSQQDDLVEAGKRLLLNNYRQAPVVMTRGEGCALWDVSGRRFLDMTAGIAVCVLGHGDAGLADTIAEQARRLVHAS